MRLNAFTDYCLRVLVYVAAESDHRATIGEIAHTYAISEHHLTKVVHFLGKAGFLRNVRGRGGGLELARPATEMNIATIVREAEGAPVPAACFDPSAARCVIAPACRLRRALQEATEAFYAALAQYTVADVVAHPRLRALLHPQDPAAERKRVLGPVARRPPVETKRRARP